MTKKTYTKKETDELIKKVAQLSLRPYTNLANIKRNLLIHFCHVAQYINSLE